MHKFWLSLMVMMLVAVAAQADCADPVGKAGSVIYNTTHNVAQFCNGADEWVNMGAVDAAAANTGCTSPVGTEGSMIFNSSANTLQFCNGADWINVGGANWSAAAQTGCTNPVGIAGDMIYNTAAKTTGAIQFCNGSAWVNGVKRKYAIPPELSISAGGVFSCIVLADSSGMCWGDNDYGQIGEEKQNLFYFKATPVTILSGMKYISAGGAYACALMLSGSVECWGRGSSGQLGDNTKTYSRVTPAPVIGVSSAAEVVTGGAHTCALLSDQTVKCWGYNGKGQIGDGKTSVYRLIASTVSTINSVETISVGSSHSCASLSDGTAWCWGDHTYGQIGSGAGMTRYYSPRQVSGLSDVIQVSAGGNHSCALVSTGNVYCWGENLDGQLGNDSSENSNIPVSVSGIDNAVQLSLGATHSCALLADGTVKCWGDNKYGRLGDGTTSDRYTPVLVSGLSTVKQVDAGSDHTCALLNDDSVKCWGMNNSGSLGDNSVSHRSLPVSVVGLP